MTLPFRPKFSMKRNGPQAATTANGPKHNRTSGGSEMSAEKHIGDSRQEINVKNSPQWNAVGDLARDLVQEMAARRAEK